MRDLYVRASGLFERLAIESPHCEVIAVTHGATMNVALAWAAGVPVEKLEMRRLANFARSRRCDCLATRVSAGA